VALDGEPPKKGGGERKPGIKTKTKERQNSPAVFLAVNVLFADAGTAVLLLFTSDADLFFSEATLSTGRKMCLGLERRVLTFPSGVLGELDLNLFVGLGLGGGLGFPVRGRENAEGDRDAGFKVQIGDL
jgi:hypothetical protein